MNYNLGGVGHLENLAIHRPIRIAGTVIRLGRFARWLSALAPLAAFAVAEGDRSTADQQAIDDQSTAFAHPNAPRLIACATVRDTKHQQGPGPIGGADLKGDVVVDM